MFWIILLIISIFLCVALLCKDHESFSATFFVISLILSGVIVCMIIKGVSVYPNLVKMRTEVLSLQSEINNIKNSRYKDVEVGTGIGGSLDNMQQSKTLSEYIKYYSDKKATFNGTLKESKLYITYNTLYWLSYGFTLSNDILDIEEIR